VLIADLHGGRHVFLHELAHQELRLDLLAQPLHGQFALGHLAEERLLVREPLPDLGEAGVDLRVRDGETLSGGPLQQQVESDQLVEHLPVDDVAAFDGKGLPGAGLEVAHGFLEIRTGDLRAVHPGDDLRQTGWHRLHRRRCGLTSRRRTGCVGGGRLGDARS
jgi:hypothetical protein